MKNNNTVSNFENLINIVKKLRGGEGCEWDKAQTKNSLIPYFIEEVYELIESIDKEDSINIKEELGDVLLHVVFQSQIASENNDFYIDDVIYDINEKLIDRHPHVFKKIVPSSDKTSNELWEEQKYKKKSRKSRLDGVPKILPSIISAQRIQEKASSFGFDWEEVSQVWGKIDDKVLEVKLAQKEDDFKKIEDELGDLLFTVVNLCRFLNVSAENALRKSNHKFFKRFQSFEKKVLNSDKVFEKFSQSELDAIWSEVKEN